MSVNYIKTDFFMLRQRNKPGLYLAIGFLKMVSFDSLYKSLVFLPDITSLLSACKSLTPA
jgi:hypothetical protein